MTVRSETWKQKRIERIVSFLHRDGAITVSKPFQSVESGNNKQSGTEHSQVMVSLNLGGISDSVYSGREIIPTLSEAGFPLKKAAMHNNKVTNRLIISLVEAHYDELDTWLHEKLTKN